MKFAANTPADRGSFRAEPLVLQLSDCAQPMNQDKPLIQEYISRAITAYKLVDSCLKQLADIPLQEIEIKIDEDEVETSAFGIMYSISLL